MPIHPIRILGIILFTLLILKPGAASAEKVAIPVFLNYPQLQFLIKRAMFTGPDDAAAYMLDNEGCNTVSFSEPHLSAEGQGLRLNVKSLVIIGANTTDGCMAITRWTGRTVHRVIHAKPAKDLVQLRFICRW